jgi:hypothetical protein
METALQLVTMILSLSERITQISQLIQTARDEGRDITSAELADLAAKDDAAREQLVQAIERARAEGR